MFKRSLLPVFACALIISCGKNSDSNTSATNAISANEDTEISMTTDNAVDYYAIKTNILKKTLDKMDFSKIDLKNSYSYVATGVDQSFTTTRDGEKISCKYKQDNAGSVIFRANKTVIIEHYYNKDISTPEACEKLGVTSKDEYVVNSYNKVISAVDYRTYVKQALTEAAKYFPAHAKPDSLISQKAEFKISNDGVSINFIDGTSISMHSATPRDPDSIWKEDMKYPSDRLDVSNFKRDELITDYTDHDSPYLGMYSMFFNLNNEDRNTYKNLAEEKITVGAVLKDLGL